VRTAPAGGILADDIDTAERLVAVEILLRVTRGTGDRLDGSARINGGTDVREFSGMLELMRVFEELIPTQRPPADTGAADPRPDVSEP
jgi:hypothetical protein